MRIPFERRFILFCLLASLGIQTVSRAAQAQKDGQDAPLRLKTELIEVRAVVTNARGQLVERLGKEDFELLENGRPQEIYFFAAERIPTNSASTSPETSAAPARPGDAAPVTRTLVFFVDTLNIKVTDLPLVKQALTKFIDEQMSEQDLCAIITSNGMLGLLEQFTRDRRTLRLAVARLRAGMLSDDAPFSAYLAAMILHEALGDQNGEATQIGMKILDFVEGQTVEPLDRVRMRAGMIADRAAVKRQATLGTMRGIVERLAKMPGQRLMAFFSPGFSLRDRLGGFATSELQSATSRAVRAGVVIYSIDASGLQPSAGYDAARPVDEGMYTADKDNQNVLNAVAKDTGGDFYFNTNDLSRSLKKVLAENEVYYTLAYYPALEKADGKFRNLSVRVKGHADYKVRAQKGYLPSAILERAEPKPAHTPQEQLAQAILAPLPHTDLGVGVAADVLKSDDRNDLVGIRIAIDGSALENREPGPKSHFEFEVLLSVFDLQGKLVQNAFDKIQGNVEASRFAQAKQNGLTHIHRMMLKPGLYHVRVGVREPGTGRIGTAITWVEATDFLKSPLGLSSLLLSQRKASQQPTSEFFPPGVSQGLQTYVKGSLLIYNAMVYTRAPETDTASLVLQIELLQGDRRVYQSPLMPLASRVMGKEKSGVEIGGQIALDLTPGFYEMRITVKDSLRKRTAQQSAEFRVVQ